MPVTVNYILPAGANTATSSVTTTQALGMRRLQYIGATNANITVTVTPFGGGGSTYGPNPCTTGSCPITFTANPGPNTLAFSLTDGGGHVLSTFVTIQIVQPGVENVFNLTANPVVKSVNLVLAGAPVPNGGTAINVPLTINAVDPGGNTIVGTGNYVDATGAPLALTLSVTNVQNGGKGTVTILGTSRITAPAQGAIYAHYDGNWLDHAAISVASTRTLAGSITGATLTTIPYMTEYPTTLSNPEGITAGPDGNLWVGEFGGGTGNTVAKITTSGTPTYYSTGIASDTTSKIVPGPDGNLWFTEQNANQVARITTSGTPAQFSGMTGGSTGTIAAGPDNALWFTEQTGSRVGRVSINGTITDYALNGVDPRGVYLGPDGNLWVIYRLSNMLSQITPNAVETDYTYADAHSSYNPDCLATGADGNIWFPDEGGYYIEQFNIRTHVFTQWSAGITNNAGIRCITAGPDGNLWFTESNTGNIGRITTGGSVTEYTPGASDGLTAASGPINITVGPDKNIWFTEENNGKVTKFVY